jgi:hypothetical protein
MAGTALTGNTVSSTYNALLKTTANTNIDSTLRVITDGVGTESALKLATDRVGTSAPNLSRCEFNQGTTVLADGATITPDFATGNVFTVTLGGNRTLANPTNIAAGATYIIIVTQDGTGSRTLAYGSYFKWQGGVAPTLTTTAGATDVISVVAKSTTFLVATSLLNLS